jgi:hypothetical protein
MPVVVVVTMPPPAIMVAPMAAVVVLVVPISFVPLPAFTIVVVVRMRPVCPFKWRTLPISPDPLVTVARRGPISFDPDEARTGRRPRLLINDSWWRGPDVHRNLR